MPREVKAKRSYNSPRRQAQASATRTAILDAARTRFETDGYANTSMDAIAHEAGVALKTVYLAFTTKSGVLRALWDLALKGDADDRPVAERPWYRAVMEEPDAEQQLRLNARNSRVVKERIGPMLELIRNAAPGDADAGALWELIQSDFYENQRAIVASIHRKRRLRAGLGVKRATDILWTLNHPDMWLLLVGERQWTPKQYEQWFADTACAQLLGSAPG